MPFEKIQELVHKDSLLYWQDIKTSALVQHVIPFLPQTPQGVKVSIFFIFTVWFGYLGKNTFSFLRTMTNNLGYGETSHNKA